MTFNVYDSIIIILFVLSTGAIGLIVLYFIYCNRKEKQWRLDNPDEWIHQEAIRRGYEDKDNSRR